MFLKKLNKDKIKRFLNNKYEIKLKVLKSLLYYSNNSNFFEYVHNFFFKFSRNSFFNRVNNVCVLTGRQSGVYRIFRLSRIQIRDSKNSLFGLRKSSW